MRSTSAAPDAPEAWPLTLPGDIPIVFRRIPAGEFWMGSRGGATDEAPRHRVRIDRAFWLGETPVTQAQYAAAGLGNPSHFSDRPDHPVEDVSWLDAVAYADWLTKTLRETFPPGVSLACLPTEAEWEYACRGGTETDYWSGDGEAALGEVGWYGEDLDSGSTHPVRAKQRPNPFGLHDLHGNVWEWCHDLWAAQAYRDHWDGIPDPGAQRRATDYQTMNVLNSDKASVRVRRGGSWNGTAWFCRSAIRIRGRAGIRYRSLGFRLCLLPGPVAASPDQKTSGARTGGGRRGTRRKPEVQGGAGIDLSGE